MASARSHPSGVGSPRQTTKIILDSCIALGFAAAGVCRVQPSRWGDHVRQWLAAGRHGAMDYLERYADKMIDPSGFLPNAQWAFVVADQYAARGDLTGSRQREGQAVGRVARYAQGFDYHRVIKKRLHTLCDALRPRFKEARFRSFTDTTPLMEREFAQRAGLGWVGKHTLVINPRLGSYVLLGGVLTTLELEEPQEQREVTDACGTCTRCIDACPTNAISPYSVDASRCISYLTIERREPVAPEFFAGIGSWIYGCDVCQEVCPHNSSRGPDVDVGTPRSEYEPRVGPLDLNEVAGWTADDRRRVLKNSSMKRATLEMMKRNALIALGNVTPAERRAEFIVRLGQIQADPAEGNLVRETARALLGRFQPGAE